MLTKELLNRFYSGLQDAENIAQLGQKDKVKELTAELASTDSATLKTVLKEFAAESDSNKTRASELRQFYGAMTCLKKDFTGLSYQNAIQDARKALKEARIRWDGKTILSEEAQQFKKANTFAVEQAMSAIQAGKTVEEAAIIQEKAKAEFQHHESVGHAEKLCNSIWAKESIDVIDSLVHMLSAKLQKHYETPAEDKEHSESGDALNPMRNQKAA
jgi:hypothetical protein